MEDTDIVYITEPEDYLPSGNELFNITSWGADMSLMDIIMAYQNNDILKPELQRKYVWDKKEASRFIESILLGLPVPSIFMANTSNYQKLIIDGYQRIMTIVDFYNGIWSKDGKIFSLYNSDLINERWRNKTYKELLPEDQRRFRRYTIHAIIFEQKHPQDDSGLYQIFERINTSGKTLNAQEIRNCVYQGKMNDLLFELNRYSNWRQLFGEQTEDSRMMDLEYILRFFALSQPSVIYNQAKSITLKKVLNDFMMINVNGEPIHFEQMKNRFCRCIDYIYEHIGENSFYNLQNDYSAIRRKFYPGVYDSIMIATDIALSEGCTCIPSEEKRLLLLKDSSYRESITQGTMQTHNIRLRIFKALEYLYNIRRNE